MRSIGRELRARCPRLILSARSRWYGAGNVREAPNIGRGLAAIDRSVMQGAKIHPRVHQLRLAGRCRRSCLREALERHGVACWIAPRDVKAGAQYADAIVRGDQRCKTFVLVLSESAIASSHVSKEIERASSKKRPIIALRWMLPPLTPALDTSSVIGSGSRLKPKYGGRIRQADRRNSRP